MAGKVQVTFDCKDPKKLAEFYAGALHYKFQDPPKGFNTWEEALKAWNIPEEDWNSSSAIVDPDGGPRIYFQQMDTPKPEKTRVHIDINASVRAPVALKDRKKQVREEVRRLVAIGAKERNEWEESGEFWVVMLDPEGNEFCVQ